MTAWPFFALTPPMPDRAPEADDLVTDYLNGLSAEDAATFHTEAEALCETLLRAMGAYLGAHPKNSGPWMWANATDMLAHVFRENLKEFVAEIESELDTDEAVASVTLENCDA